MRARPAATPTGDYVYDVARASDAYKLSCGTFLLWAVLCLSCQRAYLLERFGPEALANSALGAAQSVVSYKGDVQYLARGSTYWPDVVLAVTNVLWAGRLYYRERAFQFALGTSAAFFGLALYRNHVCRCRSWVVCHVAWHLLPLELYLGLMPAGRDRYCVVGFFFLLVALHVADRNLLVGWGRAPAAKAG